MKVVILAGGFGTRVSEETLHQPKPMIRVGEYPIIWHIMKLYYHFGFNQFVICLGYKGPIIKEFFLNYFQNHCKHTRIDLKTDKITYNDYHEENWVIDLVDTGENTMTGGRLLAVKDYLDNETFCLTYGDGLSDLDIPATITFHKQNQSIATVTCVQQPYRFGQVEIEHNYATTFSEKPNIVINAGFYVCEPGVFKYLNNDQSILESDCMAKISEEGKLSGYLHKGFWHPLDTLKDKQHLEKLWEKNTAPWKLWNL